MMRPQLNAEEAAKFDKNEVLGKEKDKPRPRRYICYHVGASKSGEKRFSTLQSAFDAAIWEAREEAIHVSIFLEDGNHEGPAILPKIDGLTVALNGDNPEACIFASNIHARVTGKEYFDRFGFLFNDSPPEVKEIFHEIISCNQIGTGNSSVLRIALPDTKLSGFTIENTYNCDRTQDYPPEPGALRNEKGQWSDETHQAVALMLENADASKCYNLRLSSYQDTLYLQQAPCCVKAAYYFSNCLIEGDIDFIFGPATGYFDKCEVRTLGGRSQNSWVTAASTSINNSYGFVFKDCRFTNDGRGACANSRFKLGRQWFSGVRLTPYKTMQETSFICRLGDENRFSKSTGYVTQQTLFSVGRCVILESHIGNHIDSIAPWDDWKGSEFLADGTFSHRSWSPWFRPVQFRVSDIHKNLIDWCDYKRLNFKKTYEEVLIGEFQNQP